MIIAHRVQRRVADRIIRRMLHIGMSQRDLAAAFGTSQSCISNKLNAKTGMTIDELYYIADQLDVPVQSLLPRE